MMETIKLGEVASILISNVDKKTKAGQQPVRLCNFVDVYKNWAITEKIAEGFMKSSANKSEIEKFSVRKGYCAITKDSETRDDIGIPTYFADDFCDVVLGYHCALLVPNETRLLGNYLNLILNSSYAKKYFEFNASGSGQRYTITNDIIASFPVPVPSLSEQQRIGDLFATIDKKLENNQYISSDLESIAKLIFEYYFVQFDFPNTDGLPYKTSGGRMIWNEELNQEIPIEWHAKTLGDISRIITDTITPEGETLYRHYSIPAFDKTKMPVYENGLGINSNKYLVPEESILVSKLNPQFKRIWNIDVLAENSICSTEFLPVVSTNNTREFLYQVLNSDSFYRYMTNSSSSSTGSRKRMPPELFPIYKIAYPSDDSIIRNFCEIISPFLKKSAAIYPESEELSGLRDFLLPLLINGQVKLHK